jgi:hypothetical protein
MDDIEAIKQLKGRYERAADTKDLALLRTTVTDDFFCDTGGGGMGATTGIEPFLDRLRSNPDVIATHHACLPEIELTSPSTATGIWAVHVMVRTPDGGGMDGYGHYHDAYVKEDGSWRLSSLQLKWLHVQPC